MKHSPLFLALLWGISCSQPVSTIEGAVLLEGGGTSGGVDVFLGDTSFSARTAADGSYQLQGMEPGSYDLLAEKAGYVTQTVTVTVSAGQRITAPELTLPVTPEVATVGRIEGTVTLTGAVSSEGVLLYVAGTALAARTAADGSYVFLAVEPGTYDLVAEKAGYITQTVAVTSAAGETTLADSLTLAFIPEVATVGRIEGTATLTGAASSEGVLLYLSGTALAARTAADGSYVFPAVEPGTYDLVAEKAGYVPGTVPVTIAAGEITLSSFALLEEAGQVISLAPAVMRPGDVARIEGTGFGAVQATSVIRVGSTLVTEYLEWTDASVRFRVPAGLAGGQTSLTLAVGNRETVVSGVRLLGQVTLAAGGAHNLALTPGGTVVAWGANGFGQATVPDGLSGVVGLAAGGAHSLALKSDGTVVAWGLDVYDQTTVPVGLSGVIELAASEHHSLALKSDGTVVAWGEGDHGQSTVPGGLSGVVGLAAGAYHSLALKADGTLVAWGTNGQGQSTVPGGLADAVGLAAGAFHSLALKADGTVVAWGYNESGQATVPGGLSGVVRVAAGESHSLALKADGTVVAWGSVTGPPAGLVVRMP